jgi:hypothetical protein
LLDWYDGQTEWEDDIAYADRAVSAPS